MTTRERVPVCGVEPIDDGLESAVAVWADDASLQSNPFHRVAFPQKQASLVVVVLGYC